MNITDRQAPATKTAAKKHNQAHTTDFLFTLGLFCVFAASAFIVVMIGIQVYQTTAAHMQDTYSTRTALSYVAEKIRQHDVAGGVSMTDLEGQDALLLTDARGDNTYLTYIYADEETLYELTVKEGTNASRSMGEQLLSVTDFSMTDLGNGFLEFTAANSAGDAIRLLLHLRSQTF